MRDLTEPVSLPNDFAPMVAAGRPELAALIPHDRTLNAEETKAVVHALAVYVKTHQQLERKMAQLQLNLDNGMGALKGAVGTLTKILEQKEEE